VTPGDVEVAARAEGLTGLAAIHALPEHGAPDGVGALVLLGMSRDGWGRFTAAPEFADGARDPLDRWSTRVVGELAAALGAMPLFPFGGPPYQPFLRWATASGRMWPSALGMSLHDEHGVWMSFRGALGFAALDGIEPAAGTRPCDTCAMKPCLKACPVDAFDGERYDVAACAAHVGSREGAACRERGCLARRACWIGQDHVPEPERAAFHMAAFLRAQA
jgi:ferredoxin